MSISICIASYGEDRWAELAKSRAYPSALAQRTEIEPGVWRDQQIITVHQTNGTVSSSRNFAAETATGDWLCFLDADDELDSGFIEAMEKFSAGWMFSEGKSLLFTPRVSNVLGGRRQPPKFWPDCSLEEGNPLVLGTLVPRALFFSVGGFIDYGDPPGSNAYEDWSLWARCWKAGARIVKVPAAIYIAHWESSSRHRGVSNETKTAWHREIECDLWPERCA